MIFGPDTASVAGNRPIDWKAAWAAGCRFAILRSNYGTDEDTAFRREWGRLAEVPGLVRGAYLYLRFPKPKKVKKTPEPLAQAEAMIATLRRAQIGPGDFPPIIDLEFSGDGIRETGMTIDQALDWFHAAYIRLQGEYAVYPIVYSSARVLRDDLGNDSGLGEYTESPLWLARYRIKGTLPASRDPKPFAGGKLDPPVPPMWGDPENWWIHQYQGNCKGLPGFSGRLDMNRFHVMVGCSGNGARGRWVRDRLYEAGHTQNTDGLKAFQKERGLVDDGIIGPRTFAYLAWQVPV